MSLRSFTTGRAGAGMQGVSVEHTLAQGTLGVRSSVGGSETLPQLHDKGS